VPPERTRLALIGIDAGDLAFVEAHRASLPHLRDLLEHGSLHHLETPSRLLTGSVWPTFYTGTPPGEHGVYHHLQWDATAMRVRRVTADWLDCEPFWYELARQGVRVCALDVPMTFPSRLERGVEVVNWGSHDQLGPFHANRPALAREILRRFGRHPMGIEVPVDKTRTQLEAVRERLVRGARRKGELACWLLAQTEWDLFLAVFGECHRGGHLLWPEPGPDPVIPPDALLDVYRAVDVALGALRAALPADARLGVFALHGMAANASQEHFVPQAIERVNALYHGASPAAPAPGRRPGMVRELRRRVPARWQNAVAQAVPVGVRDWVVARAAVGGLDWKRTPGFALVADYNGYLRLNLAGREAAGWLAPGGAEHERYTRLLRESLAELRVGPGGPRLVREAVPLREVFPGRRAERLPDWVVTWAPEAPVAEVCGERLGRLRAELDTGRSGNHRHEGFLLLDRSDASEDLGQVLDLAPWLRRRFARA
jgi:predicted AlkP superfamily phosphohydrolase/phosphomutase